ncbi:homeodomain transcription factor [Lithospermum erythrorhizon]|uniref:Homeodomain transcription factor n=1 Tax=Lithospermum erythrorhizon TaxID=34254 RepID=A0AAV3RIQ6_LITER
MGAYYTNLTSPKINPPISYSLDQKVVSCPSSDLPDNNMTYYNWGEHSVDPRIFQERLLDVNEGIQSQGLSLSLGTQIPSSVHISLYQNHYSTSLNHPSSFMNCNIQNTFEHGSQTSSKVANSEHLSFDLPGSMLNAANIASKVYPSHWHESYGASGYLYNSKYFKAARDVLDELVNVRGGLKQSFEGKKYNSLGDQNIPEEIDQKPAPEISSSERHDLRNKMVKLLSMLEEVERRYREYYEHIQVLVSSFDMVAGTGAAKSYTSLALQTISRQFRRLRDAIKEQIEVTQHSLGEEGEAANNSIGTRLPRLRNLDQKLRQQRSLQQFGILRQSWRPQKGLPETAVSILRAWLFEHFLHPYPKDSEKTMLAKQTGLTRNQVANWFINARVRLWKPMIEDMYKEEFGYTEQDSENPPDHDQTSTMATDKVHNSSRFKALEHENLEQYSQSNDQVSLALGLQQNENEYKPTFSESQLKDYNMVTTSTDLSKEYCYMEPLNQQDRFSNQQLLSDFII